MLAAERKKKLTVDVSGLPETVENEEPLPEQTSQFSLLKEEPTDAKNSEEYVRISISCVNRQLSSSRLSLGMPASSCPRPWRATSRPQASSWGWGPPATSSTSRTTATGTTVAQRRSQWGLSRPRITATIAT